MATRSSTRVSTRLSHRLYQTLIGQPVERWYLRPITAQSSALTARQQLSVRRQSIVGWLQTVLLVVVVAQSLFAGLLRVLPPEARVALAFLHRIEWGAYLAIVLVALQVAAGWADQIVVCNRFYLLAWRFGKPHVVTGKAAHYAQIGYLVFAALMVVAVLWVRAHGFIVQPAR